MKPKAFIVPLIAVVFCGIYGTTYFELWRSATKGAVVPNDFALNFFSAFGGLISSVAVMELALTETSRGIRGVTLAIASDTPRLIHKYLMYLVILLWIVTGGVSFFALFSTMSGHVDARAVITEHGKVWFGFMLGGIYAYFGLKPKQFAGLGR